MVSPRPPSDLVLDVTLMAFLASCSLLAAAHSDRKRSLRDQPSASRLGNHLILIVWTRSERAFAF
jgi:hypothetical protein